MCNPHPDPHPDLNLNLNTDTNPDPNPIAIPNPNPKQKMKRDPGDGRTNLMGCDLPRLVQRCFCAEVEERVTHELPDPLR